MSHGIPVDGPVESVRPTGRRFCRQHGRAPDADLVIVTDGDGRRLRVGQIKFAGIGTPGLIRDLQFIVAGFQILEDQKTATETLLVDDPSRRAQLHVPRTLGRRLGDVERDGAIGDQAGGVTVVGGVLKPWNDKDCVRGGTILEANRLHKGDVFRRGPIKGVHRRLGTVGVCQVVCRLPAPEETTGILAAAHAPTDLFVERAGVTAHAAIGREEHRKTAIRIGGGHRRLRVVARQVHQQGRPGVVPIEDLDVVEEILDGPVIEQDVHEGPVPRVVRAVDPLGVFVVAVAVGGRSLARSARRRTTAHKGTLKLDGVTTENLVRTGRDAVLRPLDHLDAQGRVEGAAEVVRDRKRVVVDAGLIEDDVAIVGVEILVDDAGSRPIGTVGIESNGGRKRGHTRDQGGVEVEAPLEDVAVVDGEVVHDGERPRAIQRTSDKITEIALGGVDAGVGDVVVLRIARIVRVGRLRPVAVVVDVGGDVRIRRPSVIIARARDVGSVVHGLTQEAPAATVGVAHQRHRGSVRAGDGQVEVAHVAVLHVHRHR